jgi:three-Cys-motif partner protein
LRAKGTFWKTQEDWSRRKHLILRYYLKPAAPKLASVSHNSSVFVIDGFAGRGVYEDGSPGSPIHMGELARECYKWVDPIWVCVRNIEPDETTFTALQQATSYWVQEGHIKNIQSTFQNALPTILNESKGTPLFAFLDPFAPSHLMVDDIEPLMRRSAPTEVLIVFHSPAVVRMIGAVASPKLSVNNLASSTQTLDGVYGGNAWRELLGIPVTPDDAVACFAKSLANRFPGVIVCWHGILARKDITAKYHVVFLTRHKQGVALMNEAFVKERQDVDAQEQLSLGLYQDEQWREFVEGLFGIERDKPGEIWKREHLVQESIMRRFAKRLEKEHLKAIKELIGRKVGPRIVPLDGRQTKTGSWITNDATQLKFDTTPATTADIRLDL